MRLVRLSAYGFRDLEGDIDFTIEMSESEIYVLKVIVISIVGFPDFCVEQGNYVLEGQFSNGYIVRIERKPYEMVLKRNNVFRQVLEHLKPSSLPCADC